MGYDGTEVTLWNIATKRKVGVLSGNPNFLEAIAFSPDGKVVATAGTEMKPRASGGSMRPTVGFVKVFDVASCRVRASTALPEVGSGSSFGVQQIFCTADGKYLVADVYDGFIFLDPETLTRVTSIDGGLAHGYCRAISDDSRYLASEGPLAKITILDLMSKKIAFEIDLTNYFPDLDKQRDYPHTTPGLRIAFVGETKLSVIGCGKFLMVDITTQVVLNSIDVLTMDCLSHLRPSVLTPIMSPVISPNATYLATPRYVASPKESSDIVLWDIAQNKQLWERLNFNQHNGFLLFGNGGKTLVIVAIVHNVGSCQVTLLDAATGEELGK
jgi:WD40 repeat protein